MASRIAGFALLFMVFVAIVAPAQPTIECEVVVPVLDPQQKVVTVTAPDGRAYPVFRPAPQSELVDSLKRELKTSFAQEALRLDRFARNFTESKTHANTSDEWITSPMYLLMSTEDGGFARFGFWLENGAGKRKLVLAGYVDLIVGKDSLESGDFEEIFPHELGHLILKSLTGGVPAGLSRKMHQSMTVTDYPTAFDEGYAEHFQPLARDATKNPNLRKLANGTGAVDFELLWLSAADGQLRTDGVKRNSFIHQKPLPAMAYENSPDLYRLFVKGETTTAFLPTELRNGQQMMASEGVIATLFYRFVNDDRLRNRYREAEFYRSFLASDSASPEKAITPYENVNLKLFAAMKEMCGDNSNRPPMIRLVEHYAALFPDEAKRIKAIFIETTWGATVSPQLATELARAADDGGRGDMKAFTQEAPFRLLDSIITEAAEGKRALDANVGPELWICNSNFKIARAMWVTDRVLPFTMNLNTATIPELMTIPGIDRKLATTIVAARASRGFFQDLSELNAILPPEIMLRVKALSEEMKQVSPYLRD